MFNSLNGGQIAWLLPAALIAIVALAAVSARGARTDRRRAALIMWGGWLLVTGAVLSFATGIIHTYYSIELAPAIAALVAIAAVVLWRNRAELGARVALAAGAVVTGLWSMSLLHRSSDWLPWLANLVAVAGAVAAIALLVPPGRVRMLGAAGALVGMVAISGGSAAYAMNTAAAPHTGSTPSAGPAVSSSGIGGPGGFARPGGTTGGPGGMSGDGGFPGGTRGGTPATGFTPPSGATPPSGSTGRTGPRQGSPGGGMGRQAVSAALVTLLKEAGRTWSAATIGSQSAAPLELQSGTAVLAIGGFSGSDNAPTLAQFKALVAAGKIHYFIGGGFGGGGGPGGQGGTGSSAITAWVQKTLLVLHRRRQHRLRPHESEVADDHDRARTAATAAEWRVRT